MWKHTVTELLVPAAQVENSLQLWLSIIEGQIGIHTQANIRPVIRFIFITLDTQTYHQVCLETSNPYNRRRRVWLADWWRLRNWNFHYYRCLIQAALSIIGGSNGHLLHFFLGIDMDLGHLVTEFTAIRKTHMLRQTEKDTSNCSAR